MREDKVCDWEKIGWELLVNVSVM